MKNTISTQPYKGSRDFFPEDMRIRNYIFDTWRKVCRSFGYEEYDGPFLETYELYAAKSGEELVNTQLYTFTDKGDRKVAIRPEMTPTLARMVAQKSGSLTKPIRWFSIPNLWRYEKPQRGRLREFFQLNVDIFGIDTMEADFEIIYLITQIMGSLGATSKMFEIRLNNRYLTNEIYEKLGFKTTQFTPVSKILDRKNKITQSEFETALKDEAGLDQTQIKAFSLFLEDPYKLLTNTRGATELNTLLQYAENAGIAKYLKYDPTIIRGLDYYTGNVFEQFDLTPENNRAMFGGGRYDDIIEIFDKPKLPAVGFGMGDVPMELFLKSWDLLPNMEQNEVDYLVTLWPSDDAQFFKASLEAAKKLRQTNYKCETWLTPNTPISKQISYANKKNIKKVVIIGEEELKQNKVTIKDLSTSEQQTISL